MMKTFILALSLLVSATVRSQPVPPPVNLPIRNIPQQTQGWCWAAVAQQVIYSTGKSAPALQQCALVAVANGFRPDVCCAGIGNPACIYSGSMQQIQQLIGKFGRHSSALARPAGPMPLYDILRSGRAIIVQLRSDQTSPHFVVLTGMSFVPNGAGGVQSLIQMNDPLEYYDQPILFSKLIPIWIGALVVDDAVVQD